MKEMLLSYCTRFCLVLGLLLSFMNNSIAQTELICDGETHLVEYNGSYQDFIIPDDPSISQIVLTAKGGDGGFADLDNDCRSRGGEGASLSATFILGNELGQIPHGATVRFVVGQAGEKGTAGDVLGTGFTYGGGGGGTGILYEVPNSNDGWIVLAVAGGGGGAYQGSIVGFCVDSEDGQGGQAGQEGGRGNGDIAVGDGGIAGNGGEASFEISAGGGGIFTPGEGITCIEIIGTVEVGEGQAGYPVGGAGGQSEGCVSFTFRDGGFGFGGGGAGIGAGGGGGGYSGGGGGGTTGRGGGGGSYLRDWAVEGEIIEGEIADETLDGFITYQCVRINPPNALCVGALSVPLDIEGNVSVSIDQIDNGSFHPDETSFELNLDQTNFTCENIGINIVTLTATDEAGQSSTCQTSITITDAIVPVLTCPSDISVACDTSALESTGLAFASDNCTAIPQVFYMDIIDGDCDWACKIERTWVAIDDQGNESSCTQIIEQSPIDLINDALDTEGESNEIVLGFTHKTITITADATDCIIDWLANADLEGQPQGLSNGNYIVDGSDCMPSFMDFDEDGSINNPLLAQALLLNLHLSIDPALADQEIASIDCDVPPILLQALSDDATFGELATVTNYALANLIFQPFLGILTETLACFNSNFSFCKTSNSPVIPLFIENSSSIGIEQLGNQKRFSLFPNPAKGQTFIQVPAGINGEVQISIFNLQGQHLKQTQQYIDGETTIELNINELPPGLYHIRLEGPNLDGQTQKLLIQ